MLPSVHHPRYRVLRAHLRELRKRAGLTQVELSTLLHVEQSYVSKLERGERYVDLLLYIDWCRACGIAPTEAMAKLIDASG